MGDTQLDVFLDQIKSVKKIISVAATGLISTQLLVLFTGYQPPWHPGLTIITTLMELTVLVLSFQFFSQSTKKSTNKTIIISFVLLMFFSLLYMILYSFFVFKIPSTNTYITLGCGLTNDSYMFLKENKVDINKINDTCPGEFYKILVSSQFESTNVWIPWTVKVINILLLLSWLICFGTLSLFLGVFVSFQSRIKKSQ